ncbi:alpha/beta hydrolase [Actinocrispum sp. NPDC049592]|uniref:alpha/beta fold hydrolase n=1 Tax=Actinocrispum sp. NPDC049592 TaxID=3154835 RepID=UPI00343E6025
MTIVFVHGNPESAAIWGPLLDELGRDDTVCLSPPGFGVPVPPGFEATVTGYRDWLVGELAAIGEPVDLVGHDWGGAHVVNVAMARPDLLRSWVSDVVGVFDPDYVWHQLAQAWQTPEVGEKSVAGFTGGTLEQRIQGLTGAGIPASVVTGVAEAMNDEMAQCILALYRSAAQPVMAELGRDLHKAAARPGLSILATEDQAVGSDEIRRRAADRAGARTEVLDGLNHWWMAQDPARAAAVLKDFLR